MSPLISPGDYNIGFNKEVALLKLNKISILWSTTILIVFIIIAITFFLSLFLYVFKTYTDDKKKLQREAIDKRNASIRYRIEGFYNLCQVIREDEEVFKRSAKLTAALYHPGLVVFLKELVKDEEIIYTEYPHIVPSYLKYKQLLSINCKKKTKG